MRFSDVFKPDQQHPAYGDWVLCLHCERVHKRQDWENRDLCCPTSNCDGSALDAIHWEKIREHHPEYPQVPQAGAYYPMY